MGFVTHDRFDIKWHMEREIPYEKHPGYYVFLPEQKYEDEELQRYYIERRQAKEQHVDELLTLLKLSGEGEAAAYALFHQDEEEVCNTETD